MSHPVHLGFAAVLGALALCACEGEPDDPFFFFGEVLDSKGAPLAGAPIQLLRGQGGACRLFREQSVHPSSPDGAEPPPAPFQQATTEPDGTFLFEVLRYQQDWPSCFRAELSADSGAKTIVPFSFRGTDVQADRVYLWADGAVEVSAVADGHALRLADVPVPPKDPSEAGGMEAIAYEWDVTAGGKPVWRAEWTAAPLALDSYLREDFGEAEAKVDMLAELSSRVSAGPLSYGSTYTQYASGPKVEILAGAPRVPASRGATCALGSGAPAPCPFTDGALDLVPLVDPSGGYVASLELTLASPIRPSLLILRDVQLGDSGLVRLEGSADGSTWQLISELWLGMPVGGVSLWPTGYQWLTSPRYFVRQPLAPPADPVVRLRFNFSDLLVTAVREISVFE